MRISIFSPLLPMLRFTGKCAYTARILYLKPLVTPSKRLDMWEVTVRRQERRFLTLKNMVTTIWLFSLS